MRLRRPLIAATALAAILIAGAIPAQGGTLTIQLEAGRPAYRGSEQNGIESRDYGKYSRSFAVVKP